MRAVTIAPVEPTLPYRDDADARRSMGSPQRAHGALASDRNVRQCHM
jgi:hypothetical protein